MATTTPNKTGGLTLFAWADVATANVNVGSAVDVSGKLGAFLGIKLGRRSGTAFTAGWPNIRIELSTKTSGTDAWYALPQQFQPQVGASIANTTLNGAVSAAATSITVTAATNIAAGDVLFVKGNTDAENEVPRVKSVSGTTVTLEEGLTYAHNSGNAVTDQAETYVMQPPFEGAMRMRAVVDNAGGGQTCAVEITYSTFDSLGTA
jgi:hypothetical protein